MGAYTSLHLIVRNGPRWSADERLVRRLMTYLDVQLVWTAEGYSVPLDWDAPVGEIPVLDTPNVSIVRLHDKGGIGEERLFEEHDLAPARAIRLWKKRRATCTFMTLKCANWGSPLEAELGDYARRETEHYFIPCNPSLYLGACSIPDYPGETTVARPHFQLELGGHGMPNDWQEYLRRALKTKTLTALLEFLRRESGKEWEVLMSASY